MHNSHGSTRVCGTALIGGRAGGAIGAGWFEEMTPRVLAPSRTMTVGSRPRRVAKVGSTLRTSRDTSGEGGGVPSGSVAIFFRLRNASSSSSVRDISLATTLLGSDL